MPITAYELQAEISVDTKGFDAGLRQAGDRFRTVADGIYKDVNGRLRDATGRFVKDADAIAMGLKKAGDSATKAGFDFKNFGQSLEKAGQTLSLAVTAPLVLLGKKILDVGIQYQQSMNMFQAVTKATTAEMQKAASTAEKLGADMSLPATSAADAALAMTELAKGGMSAAAAMEAARGTLQLAAAAQIEEARAAEITSNALNAFKESGITAIQVADMLAAASNASSAEINDIALALQQSSASAAALKIPMEDLTTAISLMANAGIKGSDAGTSLKTFMASLTPTTKDAAGAMKQLGIDAFDAAGKFVGFEEIIRQAAPALARMTDEQQAYAIKAAFGSDAQRAANIILGQGVEAFQQMEKAVTVSGAAADLAASKTKGLGGAWEGLKSQLETAALKIFDVAKGPLESLVRKVADAASGLASLDSSVVKAGLAIAGVAAAAGPIALLIGKIAQLDRKSILITGAIAGISALAAAYATGFGSMDKAIDSHFRALTGHFQTSKQGVTGFSEIVSQTLLGLTKIYDSWATGFTIAVERVVAGFRTLKAAAQGNWAEMVAVHEEGERNIVRISDEYKTRRLEREAQMNALLRGGNAELMKVLAAQSAEGGARIAQSFNDNYVKGTKSLAEINQKIGVDLATTATTGFIGNFRIDKAMSDELKRAEASAKAWGQKIPSIFGDAGSAARGAWDAATKRSPFFPIHDMMDTLIFAFQMPGKMGQAAKETGKAYKEGFSIDKDTKTILEAAGVEVEKAGGKMTKAAKAMAKAVNDALKESIQQVNDYLRKLGQAGDITEDILRSLTPKAQASLLVASKWAKEVGEAIKRMGLEIQFGGEKAAETFDGIRAHFDFLIATTKKATIEVVSHAKELGIAFDSLPGIARSVRAEIVNIMKVDADAAASAARFFNQFKDAWGKKQTVVEETARQIREETEELMRDLQQEYGKGFAAILKLFSNWSGESLKRVGQVADGILQVVGNLPGKFGDKLRSITDQIINFVNQVDGILRGLHKIFNQIPDGLGGLIESIKGVFKKSTEATKTASEDWSATMEKMASSASSGATRIVGALSGIAGAAMAFAGARGQGVLGGAISGALGGVAALGGIAAIFKASFAPLLAGPWGALAIGAGALFGALIGRKSAAQKAQEARQAEQQKLQIEKLKQDLQKGAQEVVQAAMQTMRDAMATLEKLADFTKVPKRTIEQFFNNLNTVLKHFVTLSGRWGKDLLDKAKAFAESMQPGVELIGLAVGALASMLNYVPVAETTIDRFFADLSKVVEKFGVLAELIPNKLEKQVKKFATRLEPAVALLEPALSGFAGLFDFKPVEDSALDAFASSLEKAMNKLGELALRMDRYMVKQAALFAERAGVVTELLSAGVEGLKSLADFKAVPIQAMDDFIAGFEMALVKLQSLSETVSIEMLAKAEMIASKSLVIFEAIKSAVEAFGALRDYKGVASEAIESLSVDFASAVTWLTAFTGFGDKIAELATQFKDSMTLAGEAITEGIEKLKLVGQLAAAALAGVTTAAAGGAFGSGGAPDFVSASAGLRSSGGSTSSTVVHQDNRVFIDGIHASDMSPERRAQLDDLLRSWGVIQQYAVTT